MSFTYDLGTPTGGVRLKIADTDQATAIFSDEEIGYFLTENNQVVPLAAARAYATIIRSRALLAKVIERQKYKSEDHALADMRLIVKDLLAEANSTGLVTSELALGDDNYESFDPGWRDDIVARSLL